MGSKLNVPSTKLAKQRFAAYPTRRHTTTVSKFASGPASEITAQAKGVPASRTMYGPRHDRPIRLILTPSVHAANTWDASWRVTAANADNRKFRFIKPPSPTHPSIVWKGICGRIFSCHIHV